MKFKGDSRGLIEGFGVLVNFLPTNFWNSFTEKMLRVATPDTIDQIEAGLIDAAQVCGYHTGYGIYTSKEFHGVVDPLIEEDVDYLYGLFALLKAWGWGDVSIVDLVPKKRLVARAENYYESEIAQTFHITRPCAYMLRGVTAAFMDIFYGSEKYPDGLYTFKAIQKSGVELGDPYAEFIIEPTPEKEKRFVMSA